MGPGAGLSWSQKMPAGGGGQLEVKSGVCFGLLGSEVPGVGHPSQEVRDREGRWHAFGNCGPLFVRKETSGSPAVRERMEDRGLGQSLGALRPQGRG